MKDLSVGDLVVVPGCRFGIVKAISSTNVIVEIEITEYNDTIEETYTLDSVAKV